MATPKSQERLGTSVFLFAEEEENETVQLTRPFWRRVFVCGNLIGGMATIKFE